jgi:outer membrane receptor protein involved in Fe transport
VGNVLTQANHELRAERLTGGETGATVSGFDGRLTARGTFFWSEITRPVANLTISTSETLIIRRRENLGRTRSRGVELETNAQLTTRLALSGGYQFVDATVLKFPTNMALEGLLIPQVPRHQMTFQFRYSSPSRLLLGIQGRAVGNQFDDDQNQFPLDRFFTLDALASRPLTHNFEVFGAAENLLNQRYTVGRTPVRTIGPPILVRVGVRVKIGSS